MKTLRVGIAAESLPPGTGVGHFVDQGLRWLARAQSDWEFHLVATASFISFFKRHDAPSNIHFHTWDDSALLRWVNRMPSARYREYLGKVGRNLIPSAQVRRRFADIRSLWQTLPRLDAVWIPHYDFLSNDLIRVYKTSLKAPVLLTIHDLHPLIFPDDWSPKLLAQFHEGFIPFAQRAPRIVTHAAFHKNEIVRRLSIPAHRIQVTPLPPLLERSLTVSLDETTQDSAWAALNRDYGIDRPYFFYPTSTEFTHKNHVRLILAWRELKSSLDSQCPLLVCTAKGVHWSQFKALIHALELERDVIYTGSVSMERLWQFYDNATAIIVPTLYEGSAAGPIAEGILAGKPVLCSRIPPIDEHLAAYEISQVIRFDPTNRQEIVAAIKRVLETLDMCNAQARVAQSILIARTPTLWSEWARVYAQEIDRVSAESKRQKSGKAD